MKKEQVNPIDMLRYENELIDNGANLICGIDEVGRGCIAGPVCAGAVILPPGIIIDGINDSKKLSPKKREELYDEIIEVAIDYSISYISQDIIDEINIRQATHMAMQNAVNDLKTKPDVLIVDGTDNINFNGIKSYYIKKGDAHSQTIAAASIIAKVSRDRLMVSMAPDYPEYGLEKHKGYGTKLHAEAIQKYGVKTIHRKSFMTDKMLGKTK